MHLSQIACIRQPKKNARSGQIYTRKSCRWRNSPHVHAARSCRPKRSETSGAEYPDNAHATMDNLNGVVIESLRSIACIELALNYTSSLSKSVKGVCRCMLWMGHRLWRVARGGMSRWPRRDRMGPSTAQTVQRLPCRCSIPGSKPTQGAILSAIKSSGLKPPETLLSKTEVQNL